jgi:hypothetical protein
VGGFGMVDVSSIFGLGTLQGNCRRANAPNTRNYYPTSYDKWRRYKEE